MKLNRQVQTSSGRKQISDALEEDVGYLEHKKKTRVAETEY